MSPTILAWGRLLATPFALPVGPPVGECAFWHDCQFFCIMKSCTSCSVLLGLDSNCSRAGSRALGALRPASLQKSCREQQNLKCQLSKHAKGCGGLSHHRLASLQISTAEPGPLSAEPHRQDLGPIKVWQIPETESFRRQQACQGVKP